MRTHELASRLSSAAVIEALQCEHGGFDLLHHWQQGEFHHDMVLAVRDTRDLPGPILVIATNCNAGVKEVLCFADVPERDALWHWRCPDNPEFGGALAPILERAVTAQWFDPADSCPQTPAASTAKARASVSAAAGGC